MIQVLFFLLKNGNGSLYCYYKFQYIYFAEKYVLFDISQCLYVQSYSLCSIKYQSSTECNVFFFYEGSR